MPIAEASLRAHEAVTIVHSARIRSKDVGISMETNDFRQEPTLLSADDDPAGLQLPSLLYGCRLYYPVSNFIVRIQGPGFDESGHSTVTDLARLRGLSTSRPSSAAM